MTFSGVVLAGGRSSRFGRDKAEYLFKGKSLMAWVLESLAAADERFIVADKPYPGYNLPVHADLMASQSPLSGLHTALNYAEHEWVALAACDLPYLSAAYWEALGAYRRGNEAVVVRRDGRLEPLAALYHKDVLGRAESSLRAGDLALQSFLAGLKTETVAWEALNLAEQTLTNVNTESDLV